MEPYKTEFDGNAAYVSKLDNGYFHVAPLYRGGKGHSATELRYAVKAFCEHELGLADNSYGPTGCQPEVDDVSDAKWVSLNPGEVDTAEVAITNRYDIRVKQCNTDKTWIASCGNFTANENTAELAVWSVKEQLAKAINTSMELV